MIVADTNLISYLLIEGAQTEAARRVWSRDSDWRVPPLWRAEFLNVLTVSVRNKILVESQALQAWRAASALLARSEVEPHGEVVLRAALQFGISAYDAHFVVVAQELGLVLVTGDRGIVRACPGLAKSISSFAGA